MKNSKINEYLRNWQKRTFSYIDLFSELIGEGSGGESWDSDDDLEDIVPFSSAVSRDRDRCEEIETEESDEDWEDAVAVAVVVVVICSSLRKIVVS